MLIVLEYLSKSVYAYSYHATSTYGVLAMVEIVNCI